MLIYIYLSYYVILLQIHIASFANNEITRSDTIDHIFNDKLNPPLNVYSDDNSDNIDDASSCFSFTDDEHDAYILNNK